MKWLIPAPLAGQGDPPGSADDIRALPAVVAEGGKPRPIQKPKDMPMEPHTRARIAAAVFAFITGRKVAGMHDHASGTDLRIAAECRLDQLQGYDGDRRVAFGGQLPELYDAGTRTYASIEINGRTARGYDRASGSAYSAEVSDQRVRLYDHGIGAWFTFDIEPPA